MIRLVRLPFLLGPRRVIAQVLLPETIFIRGDYVLNAKEMAHEVAHVWQIRHMGLLSYWFTYLRLAFTHDHASHPMEREARDMALLPEVKAEALELLGEQ